MLRRLRPFIFFVAVVLAAEPLLHTHPLESMVAGPSGNTACAICAAGTARLPVVAATGVAPHLVVYLCIAPVVQIVRSDDPLPLPSRAPPAA